MRANMTKRYFGDDANNEDDEQFSFDSYNEYDGEDHDYDEESNIAFIDSDGLVEIMHMDLAQSELNQHLLSKAIDVAKEGFFWRFKSNKKKLEEIKNIYSQLIQMTEDEKGE